MFKDVLRSFSETSKVFFSGILETWTLVVSCQECEDRRFSCLLALLHGIQTSGLENP